MMEYCSAQASRLVEWVRSSRWQLVGFVGVLMLLNKLRVGFRKLKVTDKVHYNKETRPNVTGVMLVNLGTPEGVSVPAVRRFLKEFLSDERVIDAPSHCRWLLVNCIIAPFRSPKTAELYKRIWDTKNHFNSNRGSPLIKHGIMLTEGVRQDLEASHPGKYSVRLAMRYQSPNIDAVLQQFKVECVNHIIVIPLFPQYSSACTGSIYQKVFDVMAGWDRMPHLTISSSLMDTPGFVEGFVANAREQMKNDYDHFLFSYHGIPVKQITKGSLECKLDDPGTGCCAILTERNKGCYRAQCYETSRRIARDLGIPEEKYTVTFQSRLGPTKWLQPYTDEVVEDLPAHGTKRVLVFSPAFVADCLETIDEIGSEIKKAFIKKGGEQLDLVPSLNATPIFIKSVADYARRLTVF